MIHTSNRIYTLFLCLFFSILAIQPQSFAENSDKPNIILMMADDLGWGDPGYNSMTVTLKDGITPHPDRGWINTPNLDAMASNGLQFNRFYSASAVCSPTRGSSLTGRNPERLGIHHANVGKLELDESSLPRVLSKNGYVCGHFGKWHLGTLTTLRRDLNRGRAGNTEAYSAPWHHGYDVCFATDSKVPTYHPYRKEQNDLDLPKNFEDPNYFGTSYWRMPKNRNDWDNLEGEGYRVPVEEINNLENGDDSKLIVDEAIKYIEKAVQNDQPFLAVIWFHSPHKPIVDPEGMHPVDSSIAAKRCIEDLDTAIGRVRDALTALNIHENTMVWFTSDNGPENGINSPNETDLEWSLNSGGLRARKRSLYEGGVRVPGILEWPAKISAGRVTEFPAITSDYYPTILDYLDIEVENQKPVDGISLMPLINSKIDKRKEPIGFIFGEQYSWLWGDYKLISPNKGQNWELYNLNEDPKELSPIATSQNISEKPRQLKDLYHKMLQDFSSWKAAIYADQPYVLKD